MNGNQISRNTVTHFFLKNTHTYELKNRDAYSAFTIEQSAKLGVGNYSKNYSSNKEFQFLFLTKFFHVREENSFSYHALMLFIYLAEDQI